MDLLTNFGKGALGCLAFTALFSGTVVLSGQENAGGGCEHTAAELRARIVELQVDLNNLRLEFHEARIALLETDLERNAHELQQMGILQEVARRDLEGIDQRLVDSSMEAAERAELETMRSELAAADRDGLQRRLQSEKAREHELRDQLNRERTAAQRVRLRMKTNLGKH